MFLQDIVNFVVLDLLGGNNVIDFLNDYFIYQSDVNKVLISVTLLTLSFFGAVSVVRSILKLAKGIVKIILFGVLAYLFFTVFLPLDVIQGFLN
jgi:hypothetical protein